MLQILTPQTRIKQIIDYAYTLLCNKVTGGIVQIDNEASMQLHLSNIIAQLGNLNEFAENEHFSIKLEAVQEKIGTEKSPNNARADIWMELKQNSQVVAGAAIELKCSINNSAKTDFRYSVYKDLKNLEKYQENHPNFQICEIIFTTDKNFTADKKLKFPIADGSISSYIANEGDKYKTIELRHNYPVCWDKYADNICFVEIIPEMN